VLDPSAYANIQQRPWRFRTVGDGHDVTVWRAMVHELQAAGYDGVLSIEDEDLNLNADEALVKAAAFLQQIVGANGVPGAPPR
jgi:sugar phosphate isomerase/epimerase